MYGETSICSIVRFHPGRRSHNSEGTSMSRDIGSKIRGYAWFIYPDQASPGAFAGDNPFGVDSLADESTAPGVELFWALGTTTAGLLNRAEGRSYLALTDGLEPPQVRDGWAAEPARPEDRFRIDQRGRRWVRLTRILARRDTPAGSVADCEFEVDWS
jgi:hypothetical protein